MDELDQFHTLDGANFGEARRYLGDAVSLVQNVVDLYSLLATLVRDSRASGEPIWTGSQFLYACRRDLVIAVADTMRTRFTDSFFASRRAIEIAAFAAKIAKHPHLLEVWAKAADDKNAYDDYRERFRKLFPAEDFSLVSLGGRFDVASKMAHPSIYSLASRLRLVKEPDGATTFWTDYFEIHDDDPTPIPRNFFWILDTHIEILRVFAGVLDEAVAHDRARWDAELNGVVSKLSEAKSRW